MLERQDNQVKNVLSLCMNTIKEMKTGSVLFNPNQTQSLSCPSGVNGLHHQAAEASTSDSDTDQEVNSELNMTKATLRYNNFQPRRSETSASGQINRLLDNTMFNNRRLIVSSTPLPEKLTPPVHKKLLYDQSTQTDPLSDTSMEKIEQLESVLHRLYTQFITLVSDLHISEDQSLALEKMSVRSDHNTDDVRDESATERQNTPSVDLDTDSKRSCKGLQVRRASAQTTNVGLHTVETMDDMVSLGSGNVTVPARLMTEIDWTSYTSATRQLLQAVFPRKILATHSLTGKQSPAFKNKPPKKLLEPQLVDDIVCTVSNRCGVAKRIVRSCITTKCTDEAKLYRNRQNFKKIKDGQNRENISPSPASSIESSNPRD
ncbi:early boundary activity protein 2-like isoform X2 [Bicyclus anynana]|nr:early boundary activity protein 2-like isoform X2 [Bicyclus anynana]XP_023937120.2 early boundary activity protein 2-like isoform X2 [Bicyclus anynana]